MYILKKQEVSKLDLLHVKSRPITFQSLVYMSKVTARGGFKPVVHSLSLMRNLAAFTLKGVLTQN